MANKVLVLDAGHGRNTGGKRTLNGANGVVNEWTMNNAVCNQIKNILKDYNVTIYRTDDTTGTTDVPLATRVARTNKYNPDLFVSIHHNAVGVSSWSKATGVEVYWHSQGTAADKKVANILAPKLAAKTGLRNRGVKQAAFAVLGCKPTAILVEGGFMDSSIDYPVITSSTGQLNYAKAVAETVIEYLGLTKVASSAPAPSQPSKSESSNNNATYLSGSNFLVRIKTDLNIRKSASVSSAVVGTVKKGQVFTIIKVVSGFGLLKSGVGYISMNTQYVEKVGTSSTSAPKVYKIKVVNCNTLNARKGPGTKYAVVDTVKVGTILTIVGESGSWLITKSGLYISKEYTQKI